MRTSGQATMSVNRRIYAGTRYTDNLYAFQTLVQAVVTLVKRVQSQEEFLCEIIELLFLNRGTDRLLECIAAGAYYLNRRQCEAQETWHPPRSLSSVDKLSCSFSNKDFTVTTSCRALSRTVVTLSILPENASKLACVSWSNIRMDVAFLSIGAMGGI